jgi:hypothetical protein
MMRRSEWRQGHAWRSVQVCGAPKSATVLFVHEKIISTVQARLGGGVLASGAYESITKTA